MTTIQVQINDDIIRAYGLEAIQLRIQRFLEWDSLRLAALEIHAAVLDAGLDNDALWKQARQEAWLELKNQVIKPALP